MISGCTTAAVFCMLNAVCFMLIVDEAGAEDDVDVENYYDVDVVTMNERGQRI